MIVSPSIRTFVRLFALILVLFSSYFWIRSAIIMRDNDIAILSTTNWNYNLEAAKNLCHQRADALVAVVLILLSMFFQAVISYWIPRFGDGGFNRRGLIWVCVVSILAFVSASIISERLYMNQLQRVEMILKVKR